MLKVSSVSIHAVQIFKLHKKVFDYIFDPLSKGYGTFTFRVDPFSDSKLINK